MVEAANKVLSDIPKKRILSEPDEVTKMLKNAFEGKMTKIFKNTMKGNKSQINLMECFISFRGFPPPHRQRTGNDGGGRQQSAVEHSSGDAIFPAPHPDLRPAASPSRRVQHRQPGQHPHLTRSRLGRGNHRRGRTSRCDLGAANYIPLNTTSRLMSKFTITQDLVGILKTSDQAHLKRLFLN